MSADVRGERRTFADLGPRIVSSLVLGVVAIAVLWVGGVTFALFWLAAALAILWEWQALIGTAGQRPRFLVGAVGTAIAAAFASYIALEIAGLVLLLAAALLVGVVAEHRHRL